jgi:hypothetical protein
MNGVPKRVDELTVEEARSEMYWLESYFEDCEKTGHGISSKESVRHRRCKQKVDLYDKFGIETDDIAEFMKMGHRLFASPDCTCYDCDPDGFSKMISGE